LRQQEEKRACEQDPRGVATREQYESLASLPGVREPTKSLASLLASMRTVFIDNGTEKEGANMLRNIQKVGNFLELGETLAESWPQDELCDPARLEELNERFLKLSHAEEAERRERAASKSPTHASLLQRSGGRDGITEVEQLRATWNAEFTESDIPDPSGMSPMQTPMKTAKQQNRRTPLKSLTGGIPRGRR